MHTDDEQLQLLSVFHFVLAGIVSLVSLLPLIYLGMGLAMMSRLGVAGGPGGGELPPLFVGCLITTIGGLFLVAAVGYALSLFLAARYLAARRRHMFCVVVAAISCAFSPLGTVLGVFTLIVLYRPSVREQFANRAAGS